MTELIISNQVDNPVDKIIIEAYIEIFTEDKVIPKINTVYNRAIYNVEAKAYDIIYGDIMSSINSDIVFAILSNNKNVFRQSGKSVFDAQTLLFRNFYKEEILLDE